MNSRTKLTILEKGCTYRQEVVVWCYRLLCAPAVGGTYLQVWARNRGMHYPPNSRSLGFAVSHDRVVDPVSRCFRWLLLEVFSLGMPCTARPCTAPHPTSSARCVFGALSCIETQFFLPKTRQINRKRWSALETGHLHYKRLWLGFVSWSTL